MTSARLQAPCALFYLFIFSHMPHVAVSALKVCSWDLKSEGFICENFRLTVDTVFPPTVWAELN